MFYRSRKRWLGAQRWPSIYVKTAHRVTPGRTTRKRPLPGRHPAQPHASRRAAAAGAGLLRGPGLRPGTGYGGPGAPLLSLSGGVPDGGAVSGPADPAGLGNQGHRAGDASANVSGGRGGDGPLRSRALRPQSCRGGGPRRSHKLRGRLPGEGGGGGGQDAFISDRFRVYANPDVVGVELSAARAEERHRPVRRYFRRPGLRGQHQGHAHDPGPHGDGPAGRRPGRPGETLQAWPGWGT